MFLCQLFGFIDELIDDLSLFVLSLLIQVSSIVVSQLFTHLAEQSVLECLQFAQTQHLA